LSYFFPILNLESIDLVFSLVTLLAFTIPFLIKEKK
jgi:hypothetical protein